MKILISDKIAFVNNFLTPVSKVTNSAIIKVEREQFSSLIATTDNSVILSAIYKNKNEIENILHINIPDLCKLIRILSVIDSAAIEININSNNISYTSSDIRFKYHLFEDGIITSPKLNIDKLNTLQFDGKFTLPYSNLQNLIKGSSIATDTNKIYLSYKDNTVLGELTDKARSNVDSYGLTISDNYTGIQLSGTSPLNFEVFRIISSMKFKELNCSFSSKTGVYIFDASINDITMKFIVSALAN
jgi:hypothetical protein